MDFQTMRGAIRARCGVTSADQLASDPIVEQIINEALQAIADEKPDGWPWMIAQSTWSTVGSTEGYGFGVLSPAIGISKVGWVRMRPANSTDQLALARLSRDEQLDYYPSTTADVPQSWAVRGSTVYLRPIPNDVYTMTSEVVFDEIELLSVGDEPILPARWHPAVVEYGAMQLFRRMHNGTEATTAMNAYNGWVKRMLRAARQYRGPSHVRDMDASTSTSDPWPAF